MATYDQAPIDAHNKVEPWLNGYLGVLVAEDLEAKGAVAGAVLRLGVRVEARDEAIESAEHGMRSKRVESSEGSNRDLFVE